MSDLISRSALLEEMYQKMSLMGASKDGQHPISMETVIDFIKDYPTAYNVDKVVKELKEKSFPDFEEEYTCNGELLLYLAETIDIVKGGGVNERD